MKSDKGHKRLLWFFSIWAMSTGAFALTVYGLRALINL